MFMFMFLFRTMSECVMFLCMSLFQEWLMFSVVMWSREPVPHKPGGSVMVAPKCITPTVG